MKAVRFPLAGQTLCLLFNGAAMFAFEDAFGGTDAYFEASAKPGREGFLAVCRGAHILAEQGELARRALGYDPEPMAEEELFAACVTPEVYPNLRAAVMSAILAGFGREIESTEPVDLELLELDRKGQKKTKD